MSKIIFRYGAMGASKSAHLLTTGHNFEERGFKVTYAKPVVDTRSGEYISTRAGIKPKKCLLIPENGDLLQFFAHLEQKAVLIVDESQFLSENDVDQLNQLSIQKDLYVICYGLRTDSESYLFDGSRRLIELSDAIEEIKSCCSQCYRKATMNLHLGAKAAVVLIGDEGYLPVCRECYYKMK